MNKKNGKLNGNYYFGFRVWGNISPRMETQTRKQVEHETDLTFRYWFGELGMSEIRP